MLTIYTHIHIAVSLIARCVIINRTVSLVVATSPMQCMMYVVHIQAAYVFIHVQCALHAHVKCS